MKKHTSSKPAGKCAALITTCLLLPASLASAHPGHYHPTDEVDEFDALRASYLHLHGSLEITAACTLLVAAVMFKMSQKHAVRISAAVACCASLIFLAIH